MVLKDLYKDKVVDNESLSLSRSVAIATFIVLSLGFMINAYKKIIPYEVYIAYPLGVTISFVPQLFLRMMKELKDVIATWKGDGYGR